MKLYFEQPGCPVCGLINGIIVAAPFWLLVIIAWVLLS